MPVALVRCPAYPSTGPASLRGFFRCRAPRSAASTLACLGQYPLNPDSKISDGGEQTMAPLKSMSVPKLMDLKGQVEAAITEKVKVRRNELETELSKLARH